MLKSKSFFITPCLADSKSVQLGLPGLSRLTVHSPVTILGVVLSLGVSIPLASVSGSAFAAEGLGNLDGVTGTLVTPVASDLSTDYYTVQTGDSLSRIAEKHNANIELLKSVNGISQHEVLKVGQVLKVPVPSQVETLAYAGGVGGDLPVLTGSQPQQGSAQNVYHVTSGYDMKGNADASDTLGRTLVSFTDNGALIAINASSASVTPDGWHVTAAPAELTGKAENPSMADSPSPTSVYFSSPSREKAVRDALAQSPEANQTVLNREQLNTRLTEVLKQVDGSHSSVSSGLSQSANDGLVASAPASTSQPSSAHQASAASSSGAWSVVDATTAAEAQVTAAAPSSPSPASAANGTDVLAAAPLGAETYSPFSDQAIGQPVSPDMPILPGVREFFPEVPSRFNGYLWPARGVLSSGYGWRWGRMHRGIDIAGPIGTPVMAAAAGVVVRSGWNSGGYGNVVDIRHGDGSMTRYAHNSRLLVREGQEVKQGQLISEIGSTGNSTGPHLHFEIHLPSAGTVNPIAYLPSR